MAPHPDDEVLACGVLLQQHARQGGEALIVAVTDGEASHADDPAWSPATLSHTRRKERLAGLSELRLPPCAVEYLGMPDGDVAQHATQLADALHACLRPSDVVVTTWRFDGHPDHEACGRAALAACQRRDLTLWEAPVWMWHWAEPGQSDIPWDGLVRIDALAQDLQRKSTAIQAHRSQMSPRAHGGEPVLDAAIVERVQWPWELFFRGGPP